MPDDDRFEDLTGRRFGNWSVLGYDGANEAGQNRRWWCECVCGTQRSVRAFLLVGGRSACCGRAVCKHPRDRLVVRNPAVGIPYRAAEDQAAQVAQELRPQLAQWIDHNRLVVGLDHLQPSVVLYTFGNHGDDLADENRRIEEVFAIEDCQTADAAILRVREATCAAFARLAAVCRRSEP